MLFDENDVEDAFAGNEAIEEGLDSVYCMKKL